MKAGMFRRFLLSAALLLFGIQGQAQELRQTLHSHVRPAVSSGEAALVGSLPPEQRMNLSIVLPLRNQSELAGLLKRLYDPSSPDYRHFLSVGQFTEQFGPTAEDYQAVVEFAQANGFTVSDRPANRMIVPISGTVAQIERAFHVRMNNYRHPTENRTFFSSDREPSLELNVPIAHVAGMNNYSIPRPMVTKASVEQGAVNASATGSGPGGSYLGSDMRSAYYTSALPTGSTALTGAGQTVGLAEFDGYRISDVVSSFDGTATSTANGKNYILAYTPSAGGTTYSIPVNNVLLDGASGASVSGDDAEEALDIVQAIGMAPGLSQVRVYIGASDVDVLNSMATENIAEQLSISWTWTPVDPDTDDIFFEEMAAQGQSVFAASGDYGEFDPLVDNFYPAEDAWVTSVGGTDLVTNGAGGSWGSETAWTYSGGGISPDGIPIPSWQAGVADTSNGGSATLRNVPDVAAEANFDNYDCNMGACQGGWGGTSFAAPRWAGFMALVNQQAVAAGNPTAGFIDPAIYAIGEGSDYDSDFHDITSGNNSTEGGCCGQEFFYAVTGYDLVTGWGSPDGQDLIDALAPPASAGFQLSASPSSLTISPGASATTTITMQDVDGFTGSATLSVTGLPNGVTASFGTNPVTGSSLLTLTVSSSAVRGSYLVTITGTSGSVTSIASLALEVNAPGFSIAPSSGTMIFSAGTSLENTVTVTGYAGFTGSVSLAVTSILPSGVTASWAANPTTKSSVLTLSASDSAASNMRTMVTITGTSGTLTATTTIALTINEPDYYLNVSPIPATLAQGSSVTANVTVVPQGDFAGAVTLTAPQLPPGVTATFSPNPTTGTTVLTMTASSSAPLGTSTAEVYGSVTNCCDSLYQFQQTITKSPTPTFGLGLSPAALTLTQGTSVTNIVTVIPENGFSGDVSLAVKWGLPSGVTASWSANPTSGTSVLTLTASSTASVGSGYFLGIYGTAGVSVPVYLFLTVNPSPGFTLSASSSALTVSQGASVTDTLTVTPQTGFTGNVTLSAPNLPSGLTASFGTNPTTGGTSLLTLTADCTVHAGSYLVIVAGSSGSQTVTVPITLTVNSPASCGVVSTTTALSINPSGGTLTVGASYTLTATVSPGSGSATPTGNVVFTIGSATQTVALNSSGVATYNGTAPAAAGTLTLSAAYQGTPAFSPSTSNTLNETVIKNPQAITFPAITGAQYVGGTVTLGATASSGLAVTYVSQAASVCSVDNTAGTALLIASGTCKIEATQTGDSTYAAATPVTVSFTVSKNPQTITFPAITGTQYVGGTVTLGATASSGLAVTYASQSATICTVNNTAGTASLIAAGTCKIQATQTGNSTYAAATAVSVSFTVSKNPQTITFPAITGTQYAGGTVTLGATASSGLAVSYVSQAATICTVNNTAGTATLIAGGTCKIEATQTGNSTYAAATPVSVSFTVSKNPQTITFPAITGTQYAGGTVTLGATASSGLAVNYVSQSATICTVNNTAGTATLIAGGTCKIEATQTGNSTYAAATPVSVSFTVSKNPQTITFPAITGTQYAGGTVTLGATASSGLAVTYVSQSATICTVNNTAGTATLIAGGTCKIEATQTGNSTYAAATAVSVSFTVSKNPQTITFPAITGTQYAGGTVTLGATASSGLAVSYVSQSATICTVNNTAGTATLIAGGTCKIEATQTGNSTYAAATPVSVSFTVSKNPQTITFPAITGAQYVGGTVTLGATASSGLAVSYASQTALKCSVDNTAGTASLLTAGTCTIQAKQTGNSTYAAATAVSVSFTVLKNP